VKDYYIVHNFLELLERLDELDGKKVKKSAG